MVIEKAFAKWAGCWQNLRGGMQNERTPIGTARAVRALTNAPLMFEHSWKGKGGAHKVESRLQLWRRLSEDWVLPRDAAVRSKCCEMCFVFEMMDNGILVNSLTHCMLLVFCCRCRGRRRQRLRSFVRTAWGSVGCQLCWRTEQLRFKKTARLFTSWMLRCSYMWLHRSNESGREQKGDGRWESATAE